jgi:ribonuclease HI
MSDNTIKIFYCDGGYSRSRNPKFPAYGSFMAVETTIEDGKEKIKSLDEQQWFNYKNNVTTNNEAEYATLINLLKYLKDNWNEDEVLIRMDSQLVIDTMSGLKGVNGNALKIFHKQAQTLKKACKFNIRITWITGDLMKVILGH